MVDMAITLVAGALVVENSVTYKMGLKFHHAAHMPGLGTGQIAQLVITVPLILLLPNSVGRSASILRRNLMSNKIKAKKMASNTAYYGLLLPAAVVTDTAITAVVRLAQAVGSTATAPFVTASMMIKAKKVSNEFFYSDSDTF
jgi:hypothetical protein